MTLRFEGAVGLGRRRVVAGAGAAGQSAFVVAIVGLVGAAGGDDGRPGAGSVAETGAGGSCGRGRTVGRVFRAHECFSSMAKRSVGG